MADKLLKTNALSILKNITLRPMPDVSQSSLNLWVNGLAIRNYVGAQQIGQFISAGRIGSAHSPSLGITGDFAPILVWGGGDGFAMMVTRYNMDKYAEDGVSIVSGTNDGLYQAFLAKTERVKNLIQTRNTTLSNIDDLFK